MNSKMRPNIVLIGSLIVLCYACSNSKHTYTSNCDIDQAFKQVTYANLIDSLNFYDGRYVETTGLYIEGKEQSALYSNSNMITAGGNNALWVNFSQDCPLYLKGTQQGFFEYNNGGFTQISNKQVRIRGRIDLHNRGHLNQYRACLDRVSLIEL